MLMKEIIKCIVQLVINRTWECDVHAPVHRGSKKLSWRTYRAHKNDSTRPTELEGSPSTDSTYDLLMLLVAG